MRNLDDLLTVQRAVRLMLTEGYSADELRQAGVISSSAIERAVAAIEANPTWNEDTFRTSHAAN